VWIFRVSLVQPCDGGGGSVTYGHMSLLMALSHRIARPMAREALPGGWMPRLAPKMPPAPGESTTPVPYTDGDTVMYARPLPFHCHAIGEVGYSVIVANLREREG
jgi:hypothetical protein